MEWVKKHWKLLVFGGGGLIALWLLWGKISSFFASGGATSSALTSPDLTGSGGYAGGSEPSATPSGATPAPSTSDAALTKTLKAIDNQIATLQAQQLAAGNASAESQAALAAEIKALSLQQKVVSTGTKVGTGVKTITHKVRKTTGSTMPTHTHTMTSGGGTEAGIAGVPHTITRIVQRIGGGASHTLPSHSHAVVRTPVPTSVVKKVSSTVSHVGNAIGNATNAYHKQSRATGTAASLQSALAKVRGATHVKPTVANTKKAQVIHAVVPRPVVKKASPTPYYLRAPRIRRMP